jgi:hypothetical protein
MLHSSIYAASSTLYTWQARSPAVLPDVYTGDRFSVVLRTDAHQRHDIAQRHGALVHMKSSTRFDQKKHVATVLASAGLTEEMPPRCCSSHRQARNGDARWALFILSHCRRARTPRQGSCCRAAVSPAAYEQHQLQRIAPASFLVPMYISGTALAYRASAVASRNYWLCSLNLRPKGPGTKEWLECF